MTQEEMFEKYVEMCKERFPEMYNDDTVYIYDIPQEDDLLSNGFTIYCIDSVEMCIDGNGAIYPKVKIKYTMDYNNRDFCDVDIDGYDSIEYDNLRFNNNPCTFEEKNIEDELSFITWGYINYGEIEPFNYMFADLVCGDAICGKRRFVTRKQNKKHLIHIFDFYVRKDGNESYIIKLNDVYHIKNGKVIPSLAAGFPICGYTFIEDDETVSRISKMVDDYQD